MKNNEKIKDQAKWYIVTSITGNEDTVYKNIEDKVRAYKLEDVVQEMRLLKTREITIEVFDPINNPPPTRFRNTKSITWETLPGNRYKKTRIREINRFPGYIYIKMVMADDAWYIIRNTFGVTGFVGSSGKGAKPIPMSELEVANLFDPDMNQDIVINKTPDLFVEQTVTKPKEPEKHIEFLEKVNDQSLNEEGYFDSNLANKKEVKNESENDQEVSIDNDANLNKTDELNNDDNQGEAVLENDEVQKPDDIATDIENEALDNQYLSDLNQEVLETTVKESNLETESENQSAEFQEFFEKGNSQDKNPNFTVGNTVVIEDGSMKDSEGVIESIDNNNQTAKVAVELMGRKTTVDVELSKIKKKI